MTLAFFASATPTTSHNWNALSANYGMLARVLTPSRFHALIPGGVVRRSYRGKLTRTPRAALGSRWSLSRTNARSCGLASCSAECACWGGGLSRGLVSCGNRHNLLHLANGGLTQFSVGDIRLVGSGWRGYLETHR